MHQVSINQKKSSILHRPMQIAQLYLGGILVLYFFGPLAWRTQNQLLFYLFLFLAQVLLFTGYATMIRKLLEKNRAANPPVPPEKRQIINQQAILKYLRIFIAVNLVLTILYLMRNTGLSTFSLTAILRNILRGITNADTQYLAKFSTAIAFGGRILAPIITVMSPLTWPVFPLSIAYFRKLGRLNQFLAILMIFFEAARWITTGTNKGVIDLILITVAIILIKYWQKKYAEADSRTPRKRKKNHGLVVIMVLLVIGLAFFSNNISARVNDDYRIISQITGNTAVNTRAPLMAVVPKNLQPVLVYATQYLTQGYYGLSLALNEPFIPMYGIGNSYFLIENFQQILGIDLWDLSYQARLADKGWDPFMNWHSLYVWLANDLSFLGVLILMYLLGLYLAVITYKSIVHQDPIAIALFCILLMLVFYIPCNNQILSSPITFMAFWGLNAFWFYRVKLRQTKKASFRIRRPGYHGKTQDVPI